MLKLSIINTADPAKLITCQLQIPGGTIGSGPENDIVLADEKHTIGKIQAVLRTNAQGDAMLVNLCSTSPIYLNGLILAFKQQAAFGDKDRITLGSYVLQALTETASEPLAATVSTATTVSAMPAAPPAQVPQTELAPAFTEPAAPVSIEEPAPAAPTPPAEDIFADLLNSPGTLPVGAPIQAETHPFEIPNASDRNHADPVSLLSPQGVHQPLHHHDPLLMLSRDGTEQHQATIFTDNSPGTLRQTRELDEHQEDRILQTLQQAAYNNNHENR